MLSLLTSPFVAKVMSAITITLIITSASFAVAYYREKSVTVAAQAKLSSALTLAEQAQKAAEESRAAAVKLNGELNESNRLMSEAMRKQDAIDAQSNEVMQGYETARKKPETKAWSNTPLPDNVVRLFKSTPSNSPDQNPNAPAPGSPGVYQDRAAATAH